MLFFISTILISLALIFYTVTIWTEKLTADFRSWMVKSFTIALLCDLIGTFCMFLASGRVVFNLHALLGFTAIAVMLLHWSWAVNVFQKGGRHAAMFHRYSVFAWAAWMAAFLTGALL